MCFQNEQGTETNSIDSANKEEQINFLLEDVEKNRKEYKKAIESRGKQLADIKKIYKVLKNATIAL